MINNPLFGLITLDGRLTGARYLKFLENNLIYLVDNAPLDIKQHMYFNNESTNFSRVLINYLNLRRGYQDHYIGFPLITAFENGLSH